jgi:uncharacterized OB-fold protein
MTTQDKPAPRINSINRPFFEGCNAERLMLQQCRSPGCGRHIYFPRICCPHCGGGELEWVEASGEGEIVTFTVVHRPNHASFFPEAPYYFVAVRLKEGPLMYSRLASRPESEEGLIGRRVKAVFVEHRPDQKLPFFQ